MPSTTVMSPKQSKALQKLAATKPSLCLAKGCSQHISKNLLETSVFSHVLGAEVGVTASPVPVPRDGFGIEGHDDTEVLTHPMEDEACNPEVIPHLDPFAWPHLELPLQEGRVVLSGAGTFMVRQFPPPYTMIIGKHSRQQKLLLHSIFLHYLLPQGTYKFTWAGITSALVPPIFTPA